MTVRTEIPDELLESMAAALRDRPGATMAELAAAAGVSRATLHRRFPARADLLSLLAVRAADAANHAVRAARPAGGTAVEALGRVVAALVPLGARFAFLMREGTWLDEVPDVAKRLRNIETALHRLVTRGRASGELRLDVPASYQVRLVLAAVAAAGEAVAAGELGHKEAPAAAVAALVDGIRAESAAGAAR